MTKLEVLKAARELIAVPERWTQKASARDCKGSVTYERDADAVQFCASAAITRCRGGECIETEMGARRVMYLCMGYGDGAIRDFNDSHTHAEVLALFDKAIATLEGEER